MPLFERVGNENCARIAARRMKPGMRATLLLVRYFFSARFATCFVWEIERSSLSKEFSDDSSAVPSRLLYTAKKNGPKIKIHS